MDPLACFLSVTYVENFESLCFNVDWQRERSSERNVEIISRNNQIIA
jgi:hypothetical protein